MIFLCIHSRRGKRFLNAQTMSSSSRVRPTFHTLPLMLGHTTFMYNSHTGLPPNPLAKRSVLVVPSRRHGPLSQRVFNPADIPVMWQPKCVVTREPVSTE